MKKQNNISILATDLSKVDEHLEQWMLKREKKQNIYIAIDEYILCLKDSLKYETDLVERIEIEQEIKKQEKLKQKYYVPSILGESRLPKFDEPTETTSKESSFKLLKKIKNKKRGKI